MKKRLLFSVVCLSACLMVGCGNGNNSTSQSQTQSSSTEEAIDMTKFPNFVEDYQNLSYSFGDDEIANPFWQSNVIYNETVLLTKNDETGEISGNLQFAPKKIIAVKDFTLKTKEYVQGTDFELNGNKIIAKEGSSIPYLTEANLTGDELPEGYKKVNSISNQLTDCVVMGGAIYSESPFYYGNQIQVSYVYDVNDIYSSLDKYPSYRMDKLPKLKSKLEGKQDIKITALGDSVLEGCSSSSKFNHEPFMPTFMDMTKTNIARHYGINVEMNNISVGGMQSGWGAQGEQVNKIVETNPDLLFLHFGINDLGAGVSKNIYADNMESIILNVQQSLPNCEIILLSPFAPNPWLYDYQKMQGYVDKLQEFEDTYEGVQLIDVFNLSRTIVENKKYQDMTGNGINHVNDFGSRIYLHAILATLYKL